MINRHGWGIFLGGALGGAHEEWTGEADKEQSAVHQSVR